MKHLILIALIALAPFSARANCKGTDLNTTLSAAGRAWVEDKIADVPFSVGNHWTATKGDRVIHIVGTLHINDARMDAVVDRLAPIIAVADAIMFEIVPDELAGPSQLMANNGSLVMITQGPTLLELMPEKDWAVLSKLVRKQGIAPWMAAKMKPWFLSLSLALPTCLRKTKDFKHGLDIRLADVAKRHGIPKISLEASLEVMQHLDQTPMAKQVWQLQVALPLFRHAEDNLATTVAGYFNQNVTRVNKTFQYLLRQSVDLSETEFHGAWTEPMNGLLDRRNLNWMPPILKQPGRLIVVAVGAAHLTGENGVLNLLQNNGYKLQRAQF